MIPDTGAMLLCARLSSAAYLMADSAIDAAIVPLGCRVLGRVVTAERVALVVEHGHAVYVVWQGTRVTDNTSLPEIWCDLATDLVEMPGGGRAVRGFVDPVLRVLVAVDRIVRDKTIPITHTGHSLGGVSAHVAYVVFKMLGRPTRAVSFGAPKGGDAAFWAPADTGEISRVVRLQDFAPEWPWIDHITPPWTHDAVQPGPMLFLSGKTLALATSRPGLVHLSVSDHSDARYVEDLTALTFAPVTA